MSKIINLFGGPGIGKSSIAAGLTYKLKRKHISCDCPSIMIQPNIHLVYMVKNLMICY